MLSRVLDPCIVIRVQSWDCEARAPSKVDQVLGITWPQETGAVASGRAVVICTGPTEWLVIATEPNAAALLHRLEDALEGSSFRATNVSEALTRIEINGPEVRLLLAKGCALDLHPAAFPPHRSARTWLAGMPVVIRCAQPSSFECIVSLSYREYLTSWLTDAAAEF